MKFEDRFANPQTIPGNLALKCSTISSKVTGNFTVDTGACLIAVWQGIEGGGGGHCLCYQLMYSSAKNV